MCRIHGAGNGAPSGKAHPNYRHGLRSQEFNAVRRMFERKAFQSEEAFWVAIHADEARAWEADPHNPDPIKGLFDWVAREGRRLGDGR